MDADIKHDLIVLLTIHGAILAVVMWAYVGFDVKILAGVFGSVPDSIMHLANISNLVRNNFVFGVIPGSVVLLLLDAHVYAKLRRKPNPYRGSAWFVGVTLVLLAALGFYIYVTGLMLRYY
jgi:hypothetical protein